ncbi:MAG: D-glycerate dehydrogenase [Anaerolineae bacterium]|nr:D-glycerate dehydrogenase [Anaerolineae bacterium]MDW8069702.1 D-glycerate dehydrogenase [Anaerolineae bacterium]
MAEKPTVYVTRRIPEAGLALIRDTCRMRLWEGELPPPKEVLLQEVADCDGLLCLLTDPIDAEVIGAGVRLRVISQMAVGVDNIDLRAATARGIPVGHTPGVLTEATADFTFALLMAAARRIPEGVDYVRAGKWQTWEPMGLLGVDVWGATLGIVGLGRIGAAVARRARGFAMRVLYYDPNRRPDLETELGAEYAELEDLLASSDFVSLHCPLTSQTYHLIGEVELRRMKPTAILINAARGPVVDPDALVRALSEGWIRAAALDVTEPEPIPPDHPLVSLPNCIVVPHIASATVATRERMAAMAAENLLAGLRGERLPYCANPEVYQRES